MRKAAWAFLGMGVVFGLWVMNVSQAGLRVSGCLEGCATARAGVERRLRVVSLNVLHGYPDFDMLEERLGLMAREIVRLEADVALLQEVPWTREFGSAAAYLAAKTGMNYVYLRANGNRGLIFFEEGEAILSRYLLKDIVFTELEPNADFFEHRVVLGARVAAPWGEVQVFTTHLTDGEDGVNRMQAEALRAFVEGKARGTAIVAGDFNAEEDSPQIRSLAGAWVDAYRAANPVEAGLTCCIEELQDPSEDELTKRIDYVFLVNRGEAWVRVARVFFAAPFGLGEGWLWASDHAGVYVEIDF